MTIQETSPTTVGAAVWVSLKATPRHPSVECARCRATPTQAPGPGWLRCGTNPQTWQHLCPGCAEKVQ